MLKENILPKQDIFLNMFTNTARIIIDIQQFPD